MKKRLLFIVALVVVGTATSFGQLKYGGGLSLGTKTGGDGDLGLGINARVDYFINEDFTIAPNFTYWFPSVDHGSITYWQLNADAHYTFAGDEQMSYYAIGGLNYTYWKYEYEDNWGDEWGDFGVNWSYDDNKIGINLGIGARMNMFFGELKYDTAFEQIAITAGVLF